MINPYRTYTLHFDGSSKPNPGDMTSSFLIHDDEGKCIASQSIMGGEGTSNKAEYIGLFEGVKKAVELGIKHIEIFGDSQLVINQVKGNFRCKKAAMKYYCDEIQKLTSSFHTCTLTHIPRNKNKKADKLTR
jgi:ribonuclease HI